MSEYHAFWGSTEGQRLEQDGLADLADEQGEGAVSTDADYEAWQTDRADIEPALANHSSDPDREIARQSTVEFYVELARRWELDHTRGCGCDREKTVVTTTEAAAALGISPQRVRKLAADGKLEGVKQGRDWWIEEASIERRIRGKTLARSAAAQRGAATRRQQKNSAERTGSSG